MKCKIPEISWHNRDPVLSVDIQPNVERVVGSSNTTVQRLASGGTDAHVLIWYMHFDAESSDLDLELAADLSRHQRAVNVVKWSPNGQLLASGDDESVIFIWKQKSDSEALNILENTNDEDKEVWLIMKILRGHVEDVYDLSWSPDSLYLVSGSVDNTAMLWNINKGKSTAILSDHKGFVQGVAWDPLNQYIATLSTDRHLRIFDIQTRKILQRVHKCILPVPSSHELFQRELRIYHDDTLQTFFRRLTFTPDGKLLITPAGLAEHESINQSLHTSYVFSRYCLKQPAIVLPSPDQYTVAVRCCPVLFKLRAYGPNNLPVVPLPYRMIFAVATRCSLFFYDTQQSPPFAVISNIHYTRLTDITWSNDGRIVVVSSTDGFCSLITFDAGELGEEYEQSAAMVLTEEQAKINNQKTKKTQKSQINKNNNSSKAATQISPKSASLTPIAKKNSMQKLDMPEDNEIVADEKSPVASDIEEDKDVLKVMPKLVLAAKKLATPEKKSRIATPIEVRRQPRMPTVINKLNKVTNEKLTVKDKENETQKLEEKLEIAEKKQRIAKPIEVRRKPRTPTVIKKSNEITTEKLTITIKDKDDEIKADLSRSENEIQKSVEKLEIAEKINIETDQDKTLLEPNFLIVEKSKDENAETAEKVCFESNLALNKTNMGEHESNSLKLENVVEESSNIIDITADEEQEKSEDETAEKVSFEGNQALNKTNMKENENNTLKLEKEDEKMQTDEESSKIIDIPADEKENRCKKITLENENSYQLNKTEKNVEEKQVKERKDITTADKKERQTEKSTHEEEITFVKENSNELNETEKNGKERQVKESIDLTADEIDNRNKERTKERQIEKKVVGHKKNIADKEEEKIIEKNMQEEKTSNESVKGIVAVEEEKNEQKKDLIEIQLRTESTEKEESKLATAAKSELLQEQKKLYREEIKQNNEIIAHGSPDAKKQQEEDKDISNTSLTAQQIPKALTPQQQHFTPTSERTPRRVALRTISTPKSKKKILE